MRFRHCIRAVGCLLASAFLVLSGNAWALDKVKFRLDWIPGAEHAFVYLAKEKGWFEAEGIDLEILPGQGSTVAVKLVGNRDDEFAFSDAATLLLAWERGVPLVSLMVLYHDTPTVLVTKDASDVKSLKDICGRKVGVMIKSTTYAQFKGMLEAAGVACQFEEVPVSPGGRELMADVVAAQHHYGFLIAPLMEQKGIKPRLIPARDYFHFYSQSIITNEALITEKRDLVARFMRALVRGLRYSLEHPEETLASFLKAHKEANKDYEVGKLAIVNKMFSDPGPHSEKLGMQSAAGWAKTAETLHRIKITEKLVDTKGRFTNEFLQ